MAKLIDIKCPKCAAPVHIAADATSVTCRYCGGTSVIERGQPSTPRKISVTPAASSSGASVMLVTMLVLGGATAAALTFYTRAQVAGIAGRGEGGGASEQTSTNIVSSLHFSDRPMLADVNGDGLLDLVGKTRGDGDVIAAFDGKDGAELWRTAPLSKDASEGSAFRAVVLGRVVSVDALGKAQAYDLRTGNPAWSALLGEKARAACEGKGLIVIETADELRHGLDPATGKKSEVAKGTPCTAVFSSESDTAPGYRIVDWPEMQKLGIPRLGDIPGITAHRALVPDGPGPRFMLGQRDKGTAVAMVAAVGEGKKVLWKDVVPGVDPLTTDVNVLGIEAAYIDGKLIVPYSMKGHDAGSRVACFATATGERLWDVQALLENDNSYGIAVSPESVFITAWFEATVVLSLKTGELQYRLGK